ncbi:hypothetical protein NDU88_003103 [Pleurodeles waltl]|uniref:Uncharacterized protein n=1 Tax=Pleurodeles waltl TaxID=8319 RepID=A0AAV7PCV2_PLEWA|nr:hypothetical protein NDU88_003103 [Pleurodeles waltl]
MACFPSEQHRVGVAISSPGCWFTQFVRLEVQGSVYFTASVYVNLSLPDCRFGLPWFFSVYSPFVGLSMPWQVGELPAAGLATKDGQPCGQGEQFAILLEIAVLWALQTRGWSLRL